MERLTDFTDRDFERIRKEFSPDLIAEEVFPNPAVRSRFVSVLQHMGRMGAYVEVGGRRLRALLGCTTIDLAPGLVQDAELLEEVQKLRLGPALNYLLNYPTERMKNHDVDFFVAGVSMQAICTLLKSQGFNPEICRAGGDVLVVSLAQEAGYATFVDYNQSFQTQTVWPRFAVRAPFVAEEGVFRTNFMRSRFTIYPLTMPGVERLDELDPLRVAAVGRASLWWHTARPPENPIYEPPEQDQVAIEATIIRFHSLLRDIREGSRKLIDYSTAIRDLAITERLAVFRDVGTQFDRRIKLAFAIGSNL